MRRAFRQFDKNGDGEIDRNELSAVFKEMCRYLPSYEIDRIIQRADRDGSKTISYEEFIREFFP
jgi:calmodulin